METTKKARVLSISIKTLLLLSNTLIFCLAFIAFLFYSLTTLKRTAIKQTEENLKVFTSFLPLSLSALPPSLSPLPSDFRYSIIALNGKVIYDSAEDISALPNHLDRKEVEEAIKDKSGGEHTLTRWSATLKTSLIYCAKKVVIEGNSYILRTCLPVKESVYFTSNIKLNIVLIASILLVTVLFLSSALSFIVVHSIDSLVVKSKSYKKGKIKEEVKNKKLKRIIQIKEVNALNKAVKKLAQNLKRQDRVRRDFVSNVSHELKTPVTCIVGFSETLLNITGDNTSNSPKDAIDKDKRQDIARFSSVIYKESKRLNSIINDLLTLSHLDIMQKLPDTARINLKECTADILTSFTKMANDKGITFTLNCPSPVFSLLNLPLFNIALSNIIQNAIKYSPENSAITIEITQEKKALIKVLDCGEGIPPEARTRIFERFYRVDKGRSRKEGGTGLGLSIAFHIIKLHKGKIFVEDREDKKTGACFVILLPPCKDLLP